MNENQSLKYLLMTMKIRYAWGIICLRIEQTLIHKL